MLNILQGDWVEQLRTLPDQSVHCCVTSPPYWGLRDYGVVGQLGLEKTPEEYVQKLFSGFREVRRVLRDDGTMWLNLGDSYASYRDQKQIHQTIGANGNSYPDHEGANNRNPESLRAAGLKHKDLAGIPWMVAFALRADGWYLRSDIIWHKPNPMTESVTDRPTKSHEYIFLLSKSRKYFYDAKAIAEPVSESLLRQIVDGYNGESTKDFFGSGAQDASKTKSRIIEGYRKKLDKEGVNIRMHVSRDPAHRREFNGKNRTQDEHHSSRRLLKNCLEASAAGGLHDSPFGLTRNKRTVWTVTTEPYSEEHFATFPADLIKPCILAGCPVGGTVIDPFFGSGTTGQVALELGRKCIGIELNPEYVNLAEQRCNVTPGLQLA